MTNMFEEVNDEVDVEAVRLKYKDDPEAMLNALAHSQKHISKLEAERQTNQQNDVLKEVLEYVKKGQPLSSTPPTNQSVGNADPKDDAALEQKFFDMLNKQKSKDAEDRNRELVRQAMVEKFKDKAGNEFSNIAQSVGMSTTALEALSVSNPQAFFKLANLDTPRINVNPTKSSVNPEALRTNTGGKGKPGTQSWWENFYKDNPSKVLDPRVRADRLRDWERDPDYFENN